MILYHDSLSLVDGEKSVHLTRQEAKILIAIISAYPRTISKEEIASQVWPVANDEPLNLDGHIKVVLCHIRKKLKAAGMAICFGTVWGVGFRAMHEITCYTRNRRHVAIDPSLLEDIADLLESHPNCGRASAISSRLPCVS